MAHALETRNGQASMFFSGQTPWHGLGQYLKDMDGMAADKQIGRAIKAGGMDWNVELIPLKTEDGQKVPMTRAVRRTDDRRVFGTVGLQWHPLQNRDAFEWFTPFLDSGEAVLHTGGVLHEGRKVWLLAKILRNPLEITPEDVVSKFVLLSNSHDGTTSIRAGFTPIRVVCANTLALAHRDKAASKLIRIRHTKNLEKNLDAVREVMELADQEFNATAVQYRRLRDKGINQQDLVKYVRQVFEVETPMDKLNGHQQRIFSSITRLFESGRGQDLPGVRGTYWAAYNAVSEYLSYERGKTQDTRLDSLWFGASARDNSRALEVALTMAG